MDQHQFNHIIDISCLVLFIYLNLLRHLAFMLQSFHLQPTAQSHVVHESQGSRIPCPAKIPWMTHFSIVHENSHYYMTRQRLQLMLSMEGGSSLQLLCVLQTNYCRSLVYWLTKTPELLKQYGKIIEEQERQDFIEKVDDNPHKVNIHYIPHLVKKESSTTPIQIVYDCIGVSRPVILPV